MRTVTVSVLVVGGDPREKAPAVAAIDVTKICMSAANRGCSVMKSVESTWKYSVNSDAGNVAVVPETVVSEAMLVAEVNVNVT